MNELYYYIPYKYTFPGTNIHWITSLIIIIESLIFFYQLIHYLSRPSDKTRFWYLLFIFLMIIYNFIGGLFIDPNLPIPLDIQLYTEVFVCILLTIYFAFYIYKGLNIRKLKFYTWKGSIYFLLIPFLLAFVLLSKIIANVQIALMTFVFIICLYGLYYLFILYKTLFETLKDGTIERSYKERFVGVTLTVTFWTACMSCFTFYNVNQYIEHLLTNIGFLTMSYIFIRQSIVESRKEYNELQSMNEILTQKVKERTHELEFAIEQRTNSFISLAHEIRTPLTLINNYLNEHIDKYEKTEELRIVKENVEILNNDVNTLFKEDKFLKGLSTYTNFENINFSKFVINKLASFKLHSLKKNLTLTTNIHNDIIIKADKSALQSIVNNLIENAIKFTSENGKIFVSLFPENDKIKFTVKDNGCGIPESLHSKIFSPYFQINHKKENGGIGIGLSILDNCVNSLGGSISLISNVNIGSEFTITLNNNQIINEQKIYDLHNLINPNKINIEDSVYEIDRPSVLVIEDQPDMLLFLRNKLVHEYNVYVARNGQLALTKLSSIQKLDLIISDVMMDEMDGIEFLKTISKNPEFNHIPFLFLTANTLVKNKVTCYELGAMDYIIKPFDINDLLCKIESIISNHNKQINFLKNAVFNNINNLNNKNTSDENDKITKKGVFEEKCEKFGLTKREKDIMVLIEKALSNKEISIELYISEKTVQKHCENIFSKFQVKSRLELIKKISS